MKPILFVCASLVFFTLGEAASKLWAQSTSWRWAVAVVAAYMIGSCLWLPAILAKNHLTTLGTLWNVGAILCTVFAGAVLFHEQVTALQWCGVVLALGSCVLLSI
jgi:multidrug transporter EmrE-like cation transporter